LLRQLDGHVLWISSLTFSHDDRELVSGSYDCTMRRWDLDSATEIDRMDAFNAWVRDGIYDVAEDSLLCVGNRIGAFRMDRTDSAELVFGDPNVGHMLAAIQLSPDGRLVAAAGWTRKVRIWNYQDAAELSPCIGHVAAVSDIAFLPDSRHLVSASFDNSVRMWDVEQSRETHRFLGHQGPVRTLSVAPDGSAIISGSADGTLRVWDCR